MTKHITVYSKAKAFEEANKLISGDYTYDSLRSERAGYPIFFSDYGYEWISDLGDRLEVNKENGDTINVWIEEPEYKKPHRFPLPMMAR